MHSAGRQGNTANLNLDLAGLKADNRGRRVVNSNYQTEVPHIYAVGDVIGFPALASTSMDQGRLAAAETARAQVLADFHASLSDAIGVPGEAGALTTLLSGLDSAGFLGPATS